MALAKQEVMYIPANVPDTDDPQILKTFIAEELQKIACCGVIVVT